MTHNYSDNISHQRVKNQFIKGSDLKSAYEVVKMMGAIQAQDFNMARWALGIRSRHLTLEKINNEIDEGRIIRIHLLRPTWHFVSPEDIYWLLDLSASAIISALKYRDKELGLADNIFNKCNRAIEKVLENNNHLTRDELFDSLLKTGLRINRDQISHIYIRAEMERIICSGRIKGGKPTYELLSERVPVKIEKTREEALRELCLRYFTSRGPATIKDFMWWSGISSKDARNAIENSRDCLFSETIENQTYWQNASSFENKQEKNDTFLLPAFDEFLISYCDRSAVILKSDNRKAISNNGVFYPVIIRKSKVIGTWRVVQKKDSAIISTTLFDSQPGKGAISLRSNIKLYSVFLGKEVELQ